MKLRLLILALFPLVLVLSPQVATAHAVAADPTPSPTGSPTGTPETPDDERPEGPHIAVRLFDESNDDEPIVGVTLTVTDEEGTEVGSGETDEEGRAFIPIPSAGRYTVTLEEDTLPEGIELSSGFSNELEITVILAAATNVQFPIGIEERTETPFSERLITSVTSGVKFGLIVALAALGLSLIFGTTGLTNFAHGELITLGAILTYAVNVGLGVPVIGAAIISIVLMGIFGYLQDRALWRPLRRRGTGLIAMMIVSIGLGLLLRNFFQYSVGSARQSLSQYVSQPRNEYGFIHLADKEVAIIATALLVIVVTCVLLMTTRLGKAMRAVSDNPALAASSGMRVDSVISSVWILGTALTGLAGVLLAVNSQVNFLMGFRLLLLVFAAVTLGGLGTIWGALFGSMVIGIMVEVGPLFGVPSSIKEVGALVVLILVLLVRPQGILGRKQRVG